MSLIVQKFGGTSVADAEKIQSAARKAVRARREGHQVVMVVSAMGKNTDLLIDLAYQVSDRPPAREMDMLLSTGEQVSVALVAMAVDALGAEAVSMTGGQIGILTDRSHTKARIKSISTERIFRNLKSGKIVIAAGFQGIDEDLNITTLGRGGSDTTAVALAAVLGADACEIYTDVDGVYTTDPRLLAEARRVSHISYDEMLELASLGASVMHNRSIEFGKKFSVPIHVRNSFSDIPGSYIVHRSECPDVPVMGAALTKQEARVTIAEVPDVPGTMFEILNRIAEKKVSVDMIVQDVGEAGKANISFTVPEQEMSIALDAIHGASSVLGPVQVTHDAHVSKVSVVGQGMSRQSGVAARMFTALADAGINMQMITTSEIKISALVDREHAIPALRTVHETFELHKAPAKVEPWVPSTSAPKAMEPQSILSRLGGDDMEEMFLDGIELDQTQGRVTVVGIPNEPGIAARIFDQIAKAGIFVDMIVQSFPHAGTANLSFTIPSAKVQPSIDAVRRAGASMTLQTITSEANVAKLSVSGIGLRSHTGVAIRLFQALASAGINVDMVSTSEVRINVVVHAKDGLKGKATLEAAFADVLR
jgi:aspartate kinase